MNNKFTAGVLTTIGAAWLFRAGMLYERDRHQAKLRETFNEVFGKSFDDIKAEIREYEEEDKKASAKAPYGVKPEGKNRVVGGFDD